MRRLIKTIPYSQIEAGELGVEIPGFEVECDADREVVRVYEINPKKESERKKRFREMIRRNMGVG
jgi:hypothetical protein